MKSVIYTVVAVVFLAGGAVCSGPKRQSEQQPQPQSDGTQRAHIQPGGPNLNATVADERKADTPPSYSKDIQPFLAKHCVECHNANTKKAGYNFDGFDVLIKGGRKGPAVVPGEPAKSMVVRVLSGQGKRMPPTKYTHQPKAEDVDVLKAWIAAGAKDDTENSGG
jgi:hypothetical protein